MYDLFQGIGHSYIFYNVPPEGIIDALTHYASKDPSYRKLHLQLVSRVSHNSFSALA